MCDREARPGRNLVDDPSLWTTSIPHPELSGKCFTYKYTRPSKSMNFILYLSFIQPQGVLCSRCLLFSQVNHQSVHKLKEASIRFLGLQSEISQKRSQLSKWSSSKYFCMKRGSSITLWNKTPCQIITRLNL